jgi:hypothetical protein
MMDDHIGLGGQKPAGVPGGDHRVELGGLQRQRLFAQHMLARGKGLQRPIDMEVIGQRDIDRVDGGVGEQALIAVMDPQVRRKCLKSGGFFGRRGGEGGEIRPLGRVDGRGHLLARKVRRPQNSPSDRV